MAACFAALPTAPVLSASCPALSAASASPVPASLATVPMSAIPSTALSLIPPPDEADFPVINSVKLLKAFAARSNFDRSLLTWIKIGLKRLIEPCPKLALMDSMRKFRIRV